jgi:hypothetical protein
LRDDFCAAVCLTPHSYPPMRAVHHKIRDWTTIVGSEIWRGRIANIG